MAVLDSIKNYFTKQYDLEYSDPRNAPDVAAERSLAISEKEIFQQLRNQQSVYGLGGGDISEANLTFDTNFNLKRDKVFFFRKMSTFPEIKEVISAVLDQGVYRDASGKYFSFEANSKVFNDDAVTVLNNEWHNFISNIVDFERNGRSLFKRFVEDGSIYLEMLYDRENNPTEMKGIRLLPPYTMTPVHKDGLWVGTLQDVSGMVGVTNHFQNRDTTNLTVFNTKKVVYTEYDPDALLYTGYLEAAMRPYNILKMVIDALAIYRIMRAPEKRVWNIEGGDMPPGKAEAYLQQIVNKYKTQMEYNSDTGAISGSWEVNSILKDYWFLKREGAGTDVQILQSGIALDNIDDVKLYINNLYKALSYPKTRRDQVTSGNYTNGKEIEREELAFTAMIEGFQERFTQAIKDAFRLYLQVSGYSDEYAELHNYVIRMNISNWFKDFRDQELLESKLSLYSSLTDLIYNKESNPDGPLDPDTVLEDIMKLPQDILQKNSERMKARKEKEAKEKPEEDTPDEQPPEQQDESMSNFGGGSDIDIDNAFSQASDIEPSMEDLPDMENQPPEQPTLTP